MVERLLILTLVRGGIYGLLASGFSLIFGMAHIINFAHTAFLMLAAYGMYYFMRQLGWGAGQAIVVTLAGTTLLGFLAYRFLLDRVRHHIVAVLLITMALAMVFQEIMVLIFRNIYLAAPSLIAGNTQIFGATIANQDLLTLGVMVVVIVILWLLLSRTKMGIAIRATAQDAEIANVMGVSISRTLLVTMGIATALAAIAGILIAPSWTIYPHMWQAPLLSVMVIVVLGGLGNIKGSFIGAFIVALVENLVVTFMPSGSYLKTVFVLLVMVIILVVRPGGLFGVVFEEERL
jgi:branched-chain amino acid transport system permease protein